jgi:hypothetical protein
MGSDPITELLRHGGESPDLSPRLTGLSPGSLRSNRLTPTSPIVRFFTTSKDMPKYLL